MKKMVISLAKILNIAFLLIFLYFFNIINYNDAFAGQIVRPVKISLIEAKYNNNNALFAIQLQIENGWKVYSNDPGETGLPLKIVFETPKNIKSHKIHWPPSHLYEQDGVNANVFENNVIIPIEVIPEDYTAGIRSKLYIEYGVCKDYCLRFDQELTLKIQPNYINEVGEKIISDALSESSLLTTSSKNPVELKLSWAILLAIIGGFILNLMPCVLPVLSLKVLSIIKNSGENSSIARANLLCSVAGIITSFIALAIITQVLKTIGDTVGWGFHFQEPGFIIFLAIVLILFASNLWGDFEIAVHSSVYNIANLTDNKVSNINSFLSGAFATLLATPCTAPFLTVAVAFGLSQDFFSLLIIYFFIGIGMSLPFILFSVKISLLKLLPRPGAWMIKLKKVFAIFLLLTAVWLIYILSFQLSIQAVLIFIGSLVIIKAIITNKSLIPSVNSKVVLVTAAILATYYLTFQIEAHQQISKFEAERVWERFSEHKLHQYIKEGHIVFVDITAEWCLICKMNKFTVLEQSDIISLFRDKKIKLLRGDYTNKSPEINTFLVKYHHYGIPFNAVYSKNYPNGIILPEILSKTDIVKSINESAK